MAQIKRHATKASFDIYLVIVHAMKQMYLISGPYAPHMPLEQTFLDRSKKTHV